MIPINLEDLDEINKKLIILVYRDLEIMNEFGILKIGKSLIVVLRNLLGVEKGYKNCFKEIFHFKLEDVVSCVNKIMGKYSEQYC